jgi:hypothetical protein
MATSKTKIKPTSPPKQGPLFTLPQGDSQEIEPARLLLDPQNLRLLERADSRLQNVETKLIGQKAIQDRLYRILSEDSLFDVDSLAKSIEFNGFLKHERLIVAKFDGEKYLVLEGNRRLTAVRNLVEKNGATLKNLAEGVRESLQTLPCFVLQGAAIDGKKEILDSYRRAAEIYIGMRHLMGAKSWEPASRYEFQARLIRDEHWSPAQVAERFGRKKAEVLRDFKAQTLYQDFREFERAAKLSHVLTYNAFAEASRAPSIMSWLGWSDQKLQIADRDRERAFFHYLVARLKSRTAEPSIEGEESSPQESAEAIVRRLRDMLKLKDESIEGALTDRDFDSADLLFEERKEGTFAKRISSYTRGLKRVTAEELTENTIEIRLRLNELIQQAERIALLLKGMLKK